MIRDPCLRFFGVPSNAPDHDLLGLKAGDHAPAAVQEALRTRLERMYRHPAGRSREAEIARRMLREAAQRLRTAPPAREVGAAAPLGAGGAGGRAPARTSPSAGRQTEGHRLTSFDRAVLSVLVANGGWNRRSRTMLAAIAAQHGVTVDGLVRVLRGLDAHARSGGPAFQMSEIAAATALRDTADAALVERMTEVTRKFAPELAARDSWSLTKLSLLAALLVALFLLVIFRAMVVTGELSDREQRAGAFEMVDAPVEAGSDPDPSSFVRLAPFRVYPTFRGNAMPALGSAMSDRTTAVVRTLDDLELRLASGDALDEALLVMWRDAIDVLSSGWVLTSETQMHDLRRRVLRVVAETAGRPESARRLLQQLVPPPLSILEPIDLWRGAWLGGVLAELGAGGMSPYIAEVARGQLAAALGRPSVPLLTDFRGGAGLWLSAAAQFMVERIEIDAAAHDGWEMWLAVQHRTGPADRTQGAIVGVIEAILKGSADLTRTSPTTRLFGRMLMEADFSEELVVRDAVVRWFDPASGIADADLWVLTSLLIQGDAAPWLDQTFVLMPGEPVTARLRLQERLHARWPSAAPPPARAMLPPPDVPRDLLDAWVMSAGTLREVGGDSMATAPRPVRLQHWVHLMAVNAAAEGLLRGDPGGAQRMLQLVAAPMIDPTFTSAEPGAMVRAQLHGSGTRDDGTWARDYNAAGTLDERRMMVEGVEDHARDGMGPTDASLLAELMLRGPASIRAASRRAWLARFVNDPVMVMAIIDHFHLVRSGDEDLRDVIARGTGATLAMAATDDPYFAMRRALVEHLIAILDPEVPQLEQIGQVMVEVIAYHVAMTDATRVVEVGMSDVFEAMGRLGEAQVRRMERRAPTTRLLDAVPLVRRSRAARLSLAMTPLQVLAAEQITVLQCTAFEAQQVRPHREADVQAVLDDAVRGRREAPDITAQMMASQHAIMRVMEIRLAVDAQARAAAREGER